jgi:hypothetical protein
MNKSTLLLARPLGEQSNEQPGSQTDVIVDPGPPRRALVVGRALQCNLQAAEGVAEIPPAWAPVAPHPHPDRCRTGHFTMLGISTIRQWTSLGDREIVQDCMEVLGWRVDKT